MVTTAASLLLQETSPPLVRSHALPTTATVAVLLSMVCDQDLMHCSAANSWGEVYSFVSYGAVVSGACEHRRV